MFRATLGILIALALYAPGSLASFLNMPGVDAVRSELAEARPQAKLSVLAHEDMAQLLRNH